MFLPKITGKFFTSFTNIRRLGVLLLGSKYLLIHIIFLINNLVHNTNFNLIYQGSTQCGPKVLGLIFFKNRRHMKKTHSFFLIQNNLQWHIYRVFRGRAVSEKLPKINLF